MENEINRRQFAIICFLIPMVFKTAMLPMIIAEEAGRDAYFGVIPLLLADFVQLVLVSEFVKAGGFSTLETKTNKYVKLAVSATIFAISGIKTAVFLAEVVGYVSTFLFYNVQDGIIYIIFVPVLAYTAIRGVGGIGKMSEIGIWILPLVLILGFIFGDVHIEPEYILPALAKGLMPVLKSSAKGLFWSCDFLPFMYVSLKGKQGKVPWYLVAFALSSLAIVGVYMAFIAGYGESAKMISYAFATLSAFNVVTTEIGSLEWTGSALWLTMALVYLSGYTFCGGKALGRTGLNDKISAIIFASLIGLSGVFFMKNFQEVEIFATCGVQYALLVAELAVPAACLILVKVKGKEAAVEKVG